MRKGWGVWVELAVKWDFLLCVWFLFNLCPRLVFRVVFLLRMQIFPFGDVMGETKGLFVRI